ncbi:MAG: hypothetical protein K8T25_09685 [Planctomycetia bacterium]|nr:hypothetical protein [Planctomycetia bacterium]
MKLDFELEPYKGALPVTFGMSEEQVAEILGPIEYAEQEPDGSLSEFREGMRVGYCSPPRHVVEISFTPGETLYFDGIGLLGRNDLCKLLLRYDSHPKELLGFMVFLELGVSISGYHDREKGHRAINVFSRGLYDDLLALK